MFHGYLDTNMKMIFIFLLCSNVFAVNNHFNGSFYQKFDTGWVKNGSTLDLDFANDRYSVNNTKYSGFANFVTGAGATYSRASTGTYYNSLGVLTTAASGVARLDYDPKTKESKGILIEEARTNSLLQSSAFEAASWTKANVTLTVNSITAPDGSSSADLVTATANTGTYLVPTTGTHLAGDTVTLSVYAKAGTSSIVIFESKQNATTAQVSSPTIFNLATQAITPASGVTASMQNVGNGWYRLIGTKTFAKSNVDDRWSSIYVEFHGATTAGKSFYLWGAQQELGPSATSYIPSTTAAVTRAADVFSIPTAAWYNATTGTFLGDSYGQFNAGQVYFGRIIGGDGSHALLAFNSNLASGNSWNVASNHNIAGTVTASFTRAIKMANAWDQNTLTKSMSISSAVSNSVSYTGTWAYTNIYPGGSSLNPINAPLKRITFFPVRLPDSALNDFTR
jgi:hypothetical protein